MLALVLYFRHTPTPHQTVSRWLLRATATIHHFFHWLRRPWIALAEVEALHQLNSELLSKLSEVACAEGPVAFPVGAWGDFSATRPYRLVPAEVIYQTFQARHNIVLLDKGGKAGLYPGLGVITATGILGIVAETTATYSVVYPLFHSEVHITAQLAREQVLGVTSWTEPIYNQLQLEYIPLYVTVQKGDDVWTGPSTLFPPGLRIGRIEEVQTDFSRGFHALKLRTYVDWHRLGSVYVLVPS
ncbi:MAG: hypothetical protein KatS3mg026_0849 [Bacteroidia bacterium]|nr:MAG: hypothetical protein KatS3mg026_0849 [Bacteroidia bacterium]